MPAITPCQHSAASWRDDARLMPAKYPYSQSQKNDYRDAEAIAKWCKESDGWQLRRLLQAHRARPRCGSAAEKK